MNRDPLKLEGIYYSHPVPRDSAVLTLMGFVFDKVYFPGAYLPAAGFDLNDVEKEIERLQEWKDDYDTAQLIGVLTFLKHVPTLRGFCEFQGSTSDIFGDRKFSPEAIAQIYDAIHGPPREGWIPQISSGHSKVLPGSNESVAYRGEYHQLANAIYESARIGIPLINDVPGLPVFSDIASPINDSHALAGMLSVLCMHLVLPDLPVLSPPDLMEFRAETAGELRSFRGSMLGYAKELNNGLIEQGDPAEIEKHAKFFVDTEIAPRLDELRAMMQKRSSGWIRRSIFKIMPGVIAGYMTGGQYAALAALLTGGATHVHSELKSATGPSKEARTSGLYYLLKVENSARG
jgi:hypothetical protein